MAAVMAPGCGGGGGSGGDGGGGGGGDTASSVAGAAVKGPFAAGSPIRIFSISGGRLGSQIGSGEVGATGTFRIELSDSTYSGPLAYSVSGTFASETGGTDSIPSSSPIFGVLPSFTAGTAATEVAITPLTHLAFQLALGRGSLDAESVEAALAEVSARFGLTDIARTLPRDPASSSGSEGDPEVRYGLVLAGITQQAATKGVSIAALVETLGNDAADGSLDGETASSTVAGYSASAFTVDLAAGVDTFLASSNNRTGLTAAPADLRAKLLRALVSIGAVSVPGAVGQGQQVGVTLKLTNTGGNPARLDSVTLTPSQPGFTVTPGSGNPATLAAGSSAVLQFTLSVPTTPIGGTVTFRVDVQAIDLVTSEAAGGSRANAGGLSVQSASALAIGSLQGQATAVRGGRLDMTLPLTNTGGTGARLVSAALTLSATGFTVTTDTGNPLTVEAGESVSLRFAIDVASTAATGTVRVDAQVVSEDLLTGRTGVAEKIAAGTLRVLSPAALTLGTIQGPSTVVQGQTFTLSLPVENAGQTVAVIQSVNLGFGDPGLSVTELEGNPKTLGPGISGLFRFQVTVSSGLSGSAFTASGSATAVDSQTGQTVSVTRADAGSLTVLRPAALRLDGLGLPVSLSVGQTFVATLAVTNTGETTVEIGLATLTFDDPGVSVLGVIENPRELAPAQTGTFLIRALVSNSARLGTLKASASVSGVDRLSGAGVIAAGQDLAASTVLSAATLEPVSVLFPATVSVGQSLTASLTVRNSGQSAALVDLAVLSFASAGVTATARGDNSSTVAGNGTLELRFDVLVDPAAATGVTTIGVQLRGRDSHSLLAIVGSAANIGSSLIQSAAAISLGSIPAPARVSQGQSFELTGTLTNTGQAALSVTAASLTFSNPKVTAAIKPGTFPPPLLGGGQSASLRFDATVAADAAPGVVTAVLEASGTDSNTRLTVRGSRTNVLSTVVDTPASVSVTSFTVSTATVSQGQIFQATVVLRNSGTAQALIDRVALELTGSAFTAAADETDRTLAGGGQTTYVFDVTTGETPTGPFTPETTVTARDVNSGAALSVPQASPRPTVTVQRRAAVRITSLVFSRAAATLTLGQAATITMTVKNEGDAAARLSSAQLVFAPPVLSAPAQPLTAELAKDQTRTFVFGVTASTTTPGSVTVNGDVTATDANSGLSVPVTPGSTLTVLVQRPAKLVLEDLVPALTPGQTTITVGQQFDLRVVLRNSGEATMTVTDVTIVRDLPARLEIVSGFTGNLKIPGGTTSGSSIVVTVKGTTGLGPVNVTSAVVSAHEDNTGALLALTNSLTSPRRFVVQSPAILKERTPLLPPTVSHGQTFRATVPIANEGEAALRITTVSLLFLTNAGLAPRLVAFPSAPVLGFTTVNVHFDVTVSTSAPTGATDGTVESAAVEENTTRSLSDPADVKGTVLVQTRPALTLQQPLKPVTVSQGQEFIVTVPVVNTGQAAAKVTAASIAWSRTGLVSQLAAGGDKRIDPGAPVDIPIRVIVSPTAQTGAATGTVRIDAIDLNSGSAVPQASFLDLTPVTIQKPATFSVKNVTAPARVSQGQTFSVTMAAENTGEARVRLLDGILTFSRPGVTAQLAQPVTPTLLSVVQGGTGDLIEFTATVAESMPPGPVSVDISLTAKDENSNTLDISLLRPAAVTILVEGKANVTEISAIQAQTNVSQGQSFPVTLTVRNSGQTTATISSVALTFVDAGGLTITPVPPVPASLAGGVTGSFRFLVAVGASAAPGQRRAEVRVQATDANSGQPVDAENLSAGIVTVQTPANLSTISNLTAPPVVTQGQQFTASARVTNIGQATAQVTTVALNFDNASGLSIRPLSHPLTIPGGTIGIFDFEVTVAPTAGATVRQASIGVTGSDVNSGAALSGSKPNAGSLSILTATTLAISTIVAPASVTQGQTVTATVSVTNQGQSTGTAANVELHFDDESGLTIVPLPGPSTIPSGVTTEFRFQITVSSSAKPSVRFARVVARAVDSISGLTVQSTRTDGGAIAIQTPAQTLIIQDFQAPSRVVQGQSFEASILVTNTGQATADVSSVELLFSTSQGLTVVPRPGLTSILGGRTATYTFDVTVAVSATPGERTASANVAATDRNSGEDVSTSAANLGSVLILTPAALSLSAVSAITTAAQGQTFTATFSATNTGESTALVTGVSLSFQPASGMTVTTQVSPASIDGGTTVDFTFQVVVDANAAAGARTAVTTVSIEDFTSGFETTVTDPNAGTVTIARPADVSGISDITVVPQSSVNRGQNVTASFTVSNVGEIPANVTTAGLSFTPSDGLTVTPAANPSVVGAGQTATFTFGVQVAAGASLGSRSAAASITATDANIGRDISQVKDPAGTLTVQDPAGLTATYSGPAIVNRGQTFSVSVSVTNTGGAAATGMNVAIAFSPSTGVTVTPVAAPASVAGGATELYTYSIAVGGTAPTGTRSIRIDVSAADGNNGTPIVLAIAGAGSIVIQAPADLSTVSDIVLVRPTVNQGQTGVSASFTVTNTGEASANSVAATLTFVSSNGLTVSQVSAPATIAGGQTQTYAFTIDVSAGATASVRTAQITLAAVDGTSGASVNVTKNPAGTLTVQTPAALALVTPSDPLTPNTANQGQSNRQLVVQVQNTGQADANLSSASLTFDDTSITATRATTIGTTLPGSSTSSIVFNITVPAGKTPGSYTIDSLSISAGDANDGSLESVSTGSGSLVVQIPASLVLDDVTVDLQGEGAIDRASVEDLDVRVRIRNGTDSNLASISLQSVTLDFNGGANNAQYVVVLPSLDGITIPGNTTRTLTFKVRATATAVKFAEVPVQASVTARDVNNNNTTSQTSSSAITWFVRDAAVEIPGAAQPVYGHTGFEFPCPNKGSSTPSSTSLNQPDGVAFDGTRVAIADSDNHRVLVFNSADTTTAGKVVGQQDFATKIANFVSGGSASVNRGGLNTPRSVAIADGKLFIVDTGNNRVLVYNDFAGLPANLALADVVLGQPNFTTTTNTSGQSGLNQPRDLAVAGNRLIVADTGNSRVLVYDLDNLSTGADAIRVLGQADFTGTSANRGGDVAANTLSSPRSVTVLNNKLAVADTANHRVLIFNNFTGLADGANASVFLGQAAATDGGSNRGESTQQKGMNTPSSVRAAGTRLFVSDQGNHRVLVYENFTGLGNDAAPGDLLGQKVFTEGILNSRGDGTVSNDSVCTGERKPDKYSLDTPRHGASADGTSLYLADNDNSRVVLIPVP